jgi:chromosome segregation ATPase
VVFLGAIIGLCGCTQGPPNNGRPAAQTERIRVLESKCARLEEDYRQATSAREQARQQLAGVEEERGKLEEQRAQLQKELDVFKTVARERDRLRQEVESRTTERDQLQQRCEKMKKGLQSLLGQDDAQLTPQPHPVSSAASVKPSGSL